MKKLIFVSLSLILIALLGLSTKVNAYDAVEIKPFAHYEFNDSKNPGKDSSEHGFDLTPIINSSSSDVLQIKTDDADGKNYLSLRRPGDSAGQGGALYAPEIENSGRDFSDLISGSYSIVITFRSDNEVNDGANYIVTTGRYNSSFTVVPWKNGIDVQTNCEDSAPTENPHGWCEQNINFVDGSTKEWTTLIVSCNSDTQTASIYVNGTKKFERKNDTTIKFTNTNAYDNTYTFAIGAQCNVYGGSATHFSNVDIKECMVFDCALSETNAEKITNGEKPVTSETDTYVVSLSDFDATQYNLGLTDSNTMSDIQMALPEKVQVTLSNEVTRSFPVYWYLYNGKINGYVQSGYMNPSLSEIHLDYSYVATFEYDDTIVDVTDIRLDGKAYTPGSPIDEYKHTLQFKVTVKNEYVTLVGVQWFGFEFDKESDDYYYIDIYEGANIVIEAGATQFVISYYDDEEKVGTSKYTYGGSEKLKAAPEKEGYEFVGWYLDSDLSEEFTQIDYNNPKNFSLYAKYKKVSSGSSDKTGSEKKGCNSTVSISCLLFIPAAFATAFGLKKKELK